MLQIPCPWCGPRNEIELGYGGEAEIKRPQRSESLSDEQWADYLFMRTNTRGPFREQWVCHGCRKWFIVERDTMTYEILSVQKFGEPTPGQVNGAT